MRKRRRILLALAVAACGLGIGYNSFGHKPLARYITQLRAGGDFVSYSELAATLSLNPGSSTVALTNAALQLGPFPGQISEQPPIRLIAPDRAVVNWRAATPPRELGMTNWDGALSWREAGALVRARATNLADL